MVNWRETFAGNILLRTLRVVAGESNDPSHFPEREVITDNAVLINAQGSN